MTADMKTHNQALTIQLSSNATSVEAQIRDQRAESLAAFGPLTQEQRESLATDAWTIGLRALMSAYRGAEEAHLVEIGGKLLADVDQHLKVHVERQQSAVVQELSRYFDPRSGEMATRLDDFLRDEGALSRAMNRFLAPGVGMLAQTLAKEMGENSPLLRRLSPTDSQGFIVLLETKLRETLDENQAKVTRALDPLAEDGAVARFLVALKKELAKADQDQSQQLAIAMKALDQNDETSLVSRMVRDAKQSQSDLLKALHPDVNGSPMALLQAALTTKFAAHARTQEQALAAIQESHQKTDQEIRAALVRLEERRQGDGKSPRGGYAFEAAVLRFVQNAVQGAPVVVDSMGTTVGSRPNCKKGDQVVRFTNESPYEGARIVIEAKHDAAFGVSQALREMEIARGNRGAASGLFVMARSHAPAGFPSFARHGSDILVVWDEEDERTDAYLHAGILLALALTSHRQQKQENPGDIKALAELEQRIQKELERYAKMQKMSETILKTAQDLSDEMRIGNDRLGLVLRNAKSVLKALNVMSTDEKDDRGAPVMLPADSLHRASTALRANDAGAELQELQGPASRPAVG